MGLIREPLDVDVVVDPRPFTKEEKEQISNYIREYKIRHSGKNSGDKQKLGVKKFRKKVAV